MGKSARLKKERAKKKRLAKLASFEGTVLSQNDRSAAVFYRQTPPSFWLQTVYQDDRPDVYQDFDGEFDAAVARCHELTQPEEVDFVVMIEGCADLKAVKVDEIVGDFQTSPVKGSKLLALQP